MYRGSSRSLVRLSLILAFDLLLLEPMHYVTRARTRAPAELSPTFPTRRASANTTVGPILTGTSQSCILRSSYHQPTLIFSDTSGLLLQSSRERSSRLTLSTIPIRSIQNSEKNYGIFSKLTLLRLEAPGAISPPNLRSLLVSPNS